MGRKLYQDNTTKGKVSYRRTIKRQTLNGAYEPVQDTALYNAMRRKKESIPSNEFTKKMKGNSNSGVQCSMLAVRPTSLLFHVFHASFHSAFWPVLWLEPVDI